LVHDQAALRACRNISGINVTTIDDLDLLELAPGGHAGRFIIWTAGAFKKLADFKTPRQIMSNSDVDRLIESDEIEAVVKPVPDPALAYQRQYLPNPLQDHARMLELNPYADAMTEIQVDTEAGKDSEKYLEMLHST